MIKLLTEWFELVAKQNWLKCINHSVDKYNRLNEKARTQAYVTRKLVERYNELYPNDKINMRPTGGRVE